MVVEREIEKEYNALKQHQNRLDSKVNEITQVIAAQQSYVNAAPLAEKASLNKIVEDALSMQAEMIVENNISVVNNIKETPLIRVQKTKLMQILFNLIKNAKDAMLEVPLEGRTMTMSSDCDNNSIFINVDDTGCGIQDDLLEKIFSQGFTTKNHSQGYGLHSCANHMTEMKGKIWAESDGQGKGARFILQFPINE